MNALTFEIWLRQPVLVAQVHAGDENSRTGQHFIPGSTLRGALIHHYCRDVEKLDEIGEQLFLSGKVRFLHAYPLTINDKRSLPIPRSFFYDADIDDSNDEKPIGYDLACSNEGLEKPKLLLSSNTCWIDRDTNTVKIYNTQMQSAAHNASTKRMIKQKNDSTVFRYDALAPGQAFKAVILANEDKDLHTLNALLTHHPEGMLGRTRSAGYGAVQFKNIRIEDDWHEYEANDNNDDYVVITLLSDAILINPNTGQADTTFQSLIAHEALKTFRSTHVVGGFNRSVGLPLPQALAITAGSVFVFDKTVLPEKIYQQWIETGIGERCAEGFGRVAINWQTRSEFVYQEANPPTTPKPTQLTPTSEKLAQQMATRLLRTEVENNMLKRLSFFKFNAPPQNTQLSRLRIVTRRAWRNGNLAELTEHLKNLKSRSKAQIDRCRIDFGASNSVRLSIWLEDHLKDNQLWKEFLQPTRLPKVAGQVAVVDAMLKLEYEARFLDAILKIMSKNDSTSTKKQLDAHAEQGGNE